MTTSLETIQSTMEMLVECASSHSSTIALLGAGSAGTEFYRMDQYSDIDFFLIVDEGTSSSFINNNAWFGDRLPIVFEFRDTEHGNKILLENGVFMEFAIFTEAELAKFGIPGLRLLWSKNDFKIPTYDAVVAGATDSREISYYVNQGLSNLYVGALRMKRGERFAALAMIERFALTNFLIAYRKTHHLVVQDLFNIERRAEQTFSFDLEEFLGGYSRLEESLENILTFAESNFDVNAAIALKIRELNS